MAGGAAAEASSSSDSSGSSSSSGGGGGGGGVGGEKSEAPAGGGGHDVSVEQNAGPVWLFICFAGLMGSGVIFGMVMEYATSGGRKLHELSYIFVTSVLYSITARFCRDFTGEPRTTIPLYKLLGLAFLSMTSSFTSVRSLRYVIYPVQVLAKSCKPIPVMIMGAMRGKKYPLQKYINVAVITLGVALFMGGGSATAKHRRRLLAQPAAFDPATANAAIRSASAADSASSSTSPFFFSLPLPSFAAGGAGRAGGGHGVGFSNGAPAAAAAADAATGSPSWAHPGDFSAAAGANRRGAGDVAVPRRRRPQDGSRWRRDGRQPPQHQQPQPHEQQQSGVCRVVALRW